QGSTRTVRRRPSGDHSSSFSIRKASGTSALVAVIRRRCARAKTASGGSENCTYKRKKFSGNRLAVGERPTAYGPPPATLPPTAARNAIAAHGLLLPSA